MSEFKDIALIVNSKSRKSRRNLKSLNALFKKNNISVSRTHKITNRDSFTEAVNIEERKTPDLLIIGGGDGTIYSLINQIDRKKTTVAILPLGTVNNFARSLGVNKNLKHAVKTIAHGKTKSINLGDINGHLFTNLSAIGVSVKVAQNVSDKSKKILGRLAYYIQGLYEVAVHKPFMCELKVDNQPTQRFYTHQLVVANGKYSGPIRFTANEHIESGHITAVIFGRNKRRLVHLKNILYFVFPGWLRTRPLAIQGKKIRIVTEPSRAVEVDGEAVSQTPADYKIIEGGLRVIYSETESKQ